MGKSNRKSQSKINNKNQNFIPELNGLFETNTDKKGKTKTKFLSRVFKANAGSIALSSFIYLFQSAPLWIVPLVTSNIINIVTYTLMDNLPFTMEVWTQLIINISILAFSIIQNYFTANLRLRIVHRMLRRTSAGIKSAVVKKLQSLTLTFHKDMRSGKIQSKFIKDTDSVEIFLRTIMIALIPNVLAALAAIIVSVVSNGWVSLFFLVVIPINVSLTFFFRKRIRKQAKDYRVKNEDMSAKLATMVEMIPVTKAHGLEETEIDNMNGSIINLTHSGIKLDRSISHFGTMMWVCNNMLKAICLVFCVVLAVYGHIKVGDIVLYQSMFTNISTYITAIVDMMPQFSTGFEAVRSVSEIMNVSDVEVTDGKQEVESIDGNVDFENVTFTYPNKEIPAIKNFNLSVKRGECIAVVGASGSGKTTLMNMIIGFLKPLDGILKIDGQSIEDINLSDYRQNIAVVPQNSVLFAGTIRENITYGLKDYTQEDFDRVVEMANLNEFVNDLPDGLDTSIGEHGDKLSGGQKQRITIARALIRNPKIIILDEATSALDNISEYHVQRAIESAIEGRTTFIVAHRLSTIRNADRIIVMENGENVESGTYQQLMDKKGKFYQLKQLNEVNLKIVEESFM